MDNDKPDNNTSSEETNDNGDDSTGEVVQEISAELRANFNKLEEDFRSAFDERMASFASQRETEREREAARKKAEVLRTNKIFRDIARPLGTKWRPVFERLLQDLPREQVLGEVARVEREKPFMQAYKSMNVWKEVRGEAFDVRQILDALEENGLTELAVTTRKILDADEAELFSLTAAIPGKSGPGGAGLAKSVPSSGLAGISQSVASAAASGQSTGDAPERSHTTGKSTTATAESKIDASDALDDRHILQLAKKIGGDWEPFARALGMTDDDIAEIAESEGKTYQGAFKVLWNWRDTVEPTSEQTIGRLKSALVKTGRHELAMLYQ